MARRRPVTVESSSSSESDSDLDFSSASSRKTSPNPPAEKSASSTEPLKGRDCKRKSLGDDNNNNTKSSECPPWQKKDNIQLPTDLKKLQELEKKLHRTCDPALEKALIELWHDVVCPVVESLSGIAPPRSRIWWCPTSVFKFLLLHAAGEYKKDGRSLSQLYISSYTPSLSALMKARRNDRSLSMSFGAAGQDRPAGYSFTLDNVEPELELARSLLSPVFFTKIMSVHATRLRALRALQDNTWLHFSCHGTQKFHEPFKSAFLMCDEPISLLDIAQMDLSRLSA